MKLPDRAPSNLTPHLLLKNRKRFIFIPWSLDSGASVSIVFFPWGRVVRKPGNGHQPTSFGFKRMHFSHLCLRKKVKTCYLSTPFSSPFDSLLYNNNLILLKILGTFCDSLECKNTLADLSVSELQEFWNEEVEFSVPYSEFTEEKNTRINTIDSFHVPQVRKAIICLSRL